MFVENLKKQARDKISGNIDKNYLKSKKQKKNTIPHKEKETDIQNQIRDYLRMKGWFVIRHQQSMGSLKGLSDLSALKEGITIYIEVKTSKGYQSEYQKKFQQDIESHGGVYILAREIDDVSDIEKYLQKKKG